MCRSGPPWFDLSAPVDAPCPGQFVQQRSIRTEFQHAALPAALDPSEIEVSLGALAGLTSRQASSGSLTHEADDEVHLHWHSVATFLVREGRLVTVDPAPGIDQGTLRIFLLGPVLAALLRQRGYLVLHASAVAYSGGAAAFLGLSGRGKSTLAAALHARSSQPSYPVFLSSNSGPTPPLRLTRTSQPSPVFVQTSTSEFAQ